MSVNSKMTAIANEIRELSGTTGTMGLDAMANTLHTENTNFNSNLTTQDDLITQIKNVVDGLPDAGSGGGIETCTLSISGYAPVNESYIWYVDGSSSVKSTPAPAFMKNLTITVMKNSILFTTHISLRMSDDSACQRLDGWGGINGFFISGDASVETM